MRIDDNELDNSRRRFLRAGGATLGAAALALSPLGKLLAQAGTPTGAHPGYGPLRRVRDLSTGLPLLELPAGFTYRSFGWAGETLGNGMPTPEHHDGMGVVASNGDIVTLVRNHEIKAAYGSFAAPEATYDSRCAGGTVTLRFDTARGELLEARPSLSGTLTNCSGGVTPWGSWLSCEEVVLDPGMRELAGVQRRIRKPHGFVFEVPAIGVSGAEPLTALGQFKHEAAAVHARTGIVYLTEDLEPEAGFYRCIPSQPGDLKRGGRLQMLKAVGARDLRSGQRAGQRHKVQWVDIAQPTAGVRGNHIDGVLQQGRAEGGSRFTRLEGCIATDSIIYFTATNGGDAACGQVWAYHPDREELVLIYESPDPDVLDYPDNVVVSPRGGLLLCEDSGRNRQHLWGLTAAGELFPFARNAVQLDGTRGFTGDFTDAEWAGACFSPDGRWLFANLYEPGLTVAITGPWRDGLV